MALEKNLRSIMRYYFKRTLPYCTGTLGFTEYGYIYVQNNDLVVPYADCKYCYSPIYGYWQRIENGVVTICKNPPVLDFKNLKVYDFTLFNCLMKNDVEEFTNNELKEYIADYYRYRREQICFPIVNRGAAWYNHLSIDQRTALNDWYEEWLDVTEILKEPEMLVWITDKLQKIETEELL